LQCDYYAPQFSVEFVVSLHI